MANPRLTNLPAIPAMLRILAPMFLVCGWMAASAAGAAAAENPAAENSATVKPAAEKIPPAMTRFFAAHCIRCHQAPRPKAKLDLGPLQSAASLAAESKRWGRIIARVEAGEMPPVGSASPSAIEREEFLAEAKSLLVAAVCANGPQPGPSPLRRLNRTEYGATIRDLLRIEINLGQTLPDDGAGGEGFDNAAETLTLSPLHVEKYLEAAREALDYAAKNPRSRAALLSGRVSEGRGFRSGRRDSAPEPDPPATIETARAAIERFVPRAFRRPAREGEIEPYVALFSAARESGQPFDQALLFALRGVLVSPSFLFRLEEPNRTEESRLVGQYEIASRLSYFLWASMPDDELLRLAGEGRLNDEAVLREQAGRMLKDRRTRESMESFVEQWLGTRELGRNVKPDRQLSRYTNELEWALKQEPVLYFQYVLAENRPLLDLIDSNYTFLDSKLQRHYRLQIRDVKQQLNRYELPAGSHRGGILGMAGVLAVTSLPHRTSPVLRGKWVREALLGSPPPPPPPDVPPLDDKGAAASSLSIREILEQHRQSAVCASCHNAIDPIGFGLENYDLVGRWRTEDAGKPIDASGALPDGTKFNGPEELKQVLLARKDEFVRHLTSKLLGYALGRGLVVEDQCTIDEIVRKVRDAEYRSHTLIAEIVCSVPFRYRASEK
jgi:mono/diheme cytochrome c family protein